MLQRVSLVIIIVSLLGFSLAGRTQSGGGEKGPRIYSEESPRE